MELDPFDSPCYEICATQCVAEQIETPKLFMKPNEWVRREENEIFSSENAQVNLVNSPKFFIFVQRFHLNGVHSKLGSYSGFLSQES